MAVNSKKGTFTIVTGTGDKTYANLWAFTPKFLLLWTTYQTAAGTTDGNIFAVGMTDGTRQKACSICSDDGLITSDASRRMNTSALLTAHSDATTPTIGFEATFTSWDSADLVINQTTNADGTGVIVHYLALGGDELTNVHVDQFSCNTVLGTQDITAPGFQPDFALFIVPTGTNTVGAAQGVHGAVGFGFMKDSTHQGANCVDVEDARTAPDTWRIQRNDACLTFLGASDGVVDAIAIFSAWLSTGFQIDFTNAPGGATTIFYVAFKGGTWDCGDFAIAAGTGNQDVTTTNDPKALILITDQSATENPAASEAHCALVMGASDGTTEGCGAVVDEDNPASSIVENCRTHNVTNILDIRSTNVNATGASTTLDLAADATLGASKFTLDKTTNTDAQLSRVLFISVGSVAVAAPAKESIALGQRMSALHSSRQKPIFG